MHALDRRRRQGGFRRRLQRTIAAVLTAGLMLFGLGVASTPAAAATTTVTTIRPGTADATPVYKIDSGNSGPVVWVIGGVHGSEIAGWRAADRIKDWRIDRGTLYVLPKASIRAVNQQRRAASGMSDLNRAFPYNGRPSPQTTLSRAIWDALRATDPDWVIDLHEAMSNHNLNKNSVGQTIIIYPNAATQRVANAAIRSLNQTLPSNRDFSILRYPVKGSLARGAAERLGANSMIIETSRLYALNDRIDWHLHLVEAILDELGMAPRW